MTIPSKKLTEERIRRAYYQDIVYYVCNALDRFYNSKTVCGTSARPTTHVQERLKEVLAKAHSYTTRERIIHLAERGNVGVWVWGNDEHDHLESLTCPILISADHLRELLAKIPK
jgi:hypothetical protein